MLKPEVSALTASRIRAAFRREPHQGDFLIAKLHHGLFGGGALHAERTQQGRVQWPTGQPAEAERVGIENLRAVEVRHDPADPQNAPGVQGFHAPSRSRIRSATRSALAMMVSVGFTAPIEGKKLASVT